MPTVLSRDEIRRLTDTLDEPFFLMASLLYGSGLRLMKCVRLRVQDLDFDQKNVIVRNGKGEKDRIAALPEILVPALRAQLELVKQWHDNDLSHEGGEVLFRYAPHRRSAETAREWRLQYLFPSSRLSVDPKTRKVYRDHIHHSTVQKAIKTAARDCDIRRNVTCHSLCHSFATHLLQDGANIRVIQELMGHRDLNTTMVYLHVKDIRDERSRTNPGDSVF